MIKVVVSDIVNVVWNPNGFNQILYQKWGEIVGLDKETFEKEYRQVYRGFETDKMEFDDWVRRNFGNNVKEFETILRETADRLVKNGMNQELIETYQKLREGGLTVGCLTNVENMFYPLFKKRGLYQGFDFCIASCEVKSRKPDKKIYQEVFKYGDWRPEEIVFIDDKEENVEAAKRLGIYGIKFNNCKQLLNRLKNKLE
jgi:epoxide hydrolase-like predicted phosphatase